jgi:hypothetical protein
MVSSQKSALKRRNGHINIDNLLRESETSGYTRDYLERVKAVTWDRSFIEVCRTDKRKDHNARETKDQLVGLGPPKTNRADLIVILYGYSVPVILRPVVDVQGYEFVVERK